MALFILAVIIFIIADITIRYFAKRFQETKTQKEREEVLKESLSLDFSLEAKTLKRADVENPKARILCVDDETVILDSFRKILVLDGYSVDTVENGKEAVGLVQTHSYDFVFTDLKMPVMDGVEVTKAVKHIRPDIDVIIITGYATVETAVECMKYGAMDYVQKPFTEDELLEFTKKSLIKREDKISKMLKPKVQITQFKETGTKTPEFQIPGGVFISDGHCWANISEDGSAKVGLDDFANKVIGKIDSVELPNLGMTVKKGQPLFTIEQGMRNLAFMSPLSGKVKEINKFINEEIDSLSVTSYDQNWICEMDPDDLDIELPNLKIGKSAVSFYQDEIERLQALKKKTMTGKEAEAEPEGTIFIGEMEKLDEINWKRFATEFFEK